jgi:hypothetical protein
LWSVVVVVVALMLVVVVVVGKWSTKQRLPLRLVLQSVL